MIRLVKMCKIPFAFLFLMSMVLIIGLFIKMNIELLSTNFLKYKLAKVYPTTSNDKLNTTQSNIKLVHAFSKFYSKTEPTHLKRAKQTPHTCEFKILNKSSNLDLIFLN